MLHYAAHKCHPCPFQALDKYCLSPQNKAFAPGGSDAVRILCSGVYPVAVGLINSVVTGGVWEFVIQWYVLMSDIIPQFQKDLVHFTGGPVWRADAPARGHWNLLSSRINVSGINMFYLMRKVANTYLRSNVEMLCMPESAQTSWWRGVVWSIHNFYETELNRMLAVNRCYHLVI
jgi:hypothetical protein